MSLKGDRIELYTDISNFGNSVMTRGGIASYQTVGSGAAMDQAAALVQYAAATTGVVPAGLLLNDMVSLDLTRQHMNYYQDQTILGGKVTLLKKGYVVTNSLTQGVAAIGVGDVAVLTSSGNLMNVSNANSFTINKAVNPIVGKFMSTADEDGYAKVQIDIQ
jgi:hypothetical protein